MLLNYEFKQETIKFYLLKVRMAVEKTDVIIVGGGASGLMAAIAAGRCGQRVVICEKMKRPGLKILASGGERCNVTNTLDSETYMERFGRFGRFMSPALTLLSNTKLIAMFSELGIETMSRDGFRVFPSSHKSETVLNGLLGEIKRLGVKLLLDIKVEGIEKEGREWKVTTNKLSFIAPKVVVATGGLSYKHLGSTGDGYRFASKLGHRVTDTFPGGVPLTTKETWTKKCRADTIGKAKITVDMKKHKNISKVGDVIFTQYGIAGPLVLDLSAHLTPLVEKYGEVPLLLQLRPKMTQQVWQDIFMGWKKSSSKKKCLAEFLLKYLPRSISEVLCEMADINLTSVLGEISQDKLNHLIKLLSATPLTITGSQGYKLAFVTKGGVRLKDVSPDTLESKVSPGIFFCGEVLDLNGPCGGYNLQWAFASGFLAGTHIKSSK